MIQRQLKIVIKKIVINSNLPSCINCSNYVEDKKYGKCKLFGEKNMITGEIKYLDAIYCREDPQLCGKNAKNYNPK
jgi:hypothetical protein